MSLISLPVYTDLVPANFCFNGFNSPSWNYLVSLLHVHLPSNVASLTVGTSPPGPGGDVDLTQFPWLQIDNNGLPVRLWRYAATPVGGWVAPHPITPPTVGKGFLMAYYPDAATNSAAQTEIAGLEKSKSTSLSETVTAYSGPFWQIVPDMEGRTIVGAGDHVANSVTTSFVVKVPGGEVKHELLLKEIPSHTHKHWMYRDGNTPLDADMQGVKGHISKDWTTDAAGGDPDNDNETTPHENMPPYRVMYWLYRTARTHYVYDPLNP